MTNKEFKTREIKPKQRVENKNSIIKNNDKNQAGKIKALHILGIWYHSYA